MQQKNEPYLASESDVPELMSLWESCFPEDGGDTVRRFFNTVFSDTLTPVISADGKIRSMLFMVESYIVISGKEHKAYYLYCVCTQKEYRRRGYMGSLLSFAADTAKSRGAEYLFLVPAEDYLFDVYASFGFCEAIYRREEAVTYGSLPPFECEDVPLTPEIITNLLHFDKAGFNYCFFSHSMVKYVLTSMMAENACVCVRCGGAVSYCLYERNTSGVTVLEAFSQDGDVRPVLSRVLLHEQVDSLTAYLPAKSADASHRYGMVLPLSGVDVPVGLYFGIAYG